MDQKAESVVMTSFERFQQRFQPDRNLSLSALLQREEAFAANLEYIRTANAQNLTYTLGVNQFSDLTNAEYSTRHFSSAHKQSRVAGPAEPEVLLSPQMQPESIDWAAAGAVSAVIDQGACGSCWAIATAGAIEGAHKIATGHLVPLSVQQWVDCDRGMLDLDLGCQGGNIDSAMSFAKKNSLCAATSYPYSATDNNTCQASNCTVALRQGAVESFKGVAKIPEIDPATEQAMMAAVARQPVAAWTEADKPIFQHYQSGVLSGACGGGKDHAVLVVGYGTLNGVDYWKVMTVLLFIYLCHSMLSFQVKNSFGKSWGMAGFVLLKRGNSGQRSGECGVLQWPTYPVLAHS